MSNDRAPRGGASHSRLRCALGFIIGLAVTGLACDRRGFWECEDPLPTLRAIRPPPDSSLLYEGVPGLFDGACGLSVERAFASNADEQRITLALADDVERLGFRRVAAHVDSEFWCKRAGRFHEFRRADLLLRFVVDPLPFEYGHGSVLPRGQARWGVLLSVRNFDQERHTECARAH